MGTMKPYLLITLLAVSSILNAAEKTIEVNKSPLAVNESLQKMMDIDGVKPLYADCSSRFVDDSDGMRTEKVFNCLWDSVQKNKDLKKKVMAVYTEEVKSKPTTSTATPTNNRAPASTAAEDKISLTSRSINAGTNYEVDPSVDLLSKFYGKKLDEILDPDKALSKAEVKNGVILSVDHKQFIEIYKSELGKSIVNSFTSFCLDSDDDLKIPDPENDKDDKQLKANRKANIDSLKNGGIKSLELGSSDSSRWTKCIMKVPELCEVKNSGTSNVKIDETAKRACLIVDFVKSARKNLMAADKQLEGYKNLDANKTLRIVGNTKSVDAKKSSTSALLEMTSTDVETTLKDPLIAKTKEFEKCATTDKEGKMTIVNAEACKAYLSTNTEGNTKALQELGMRQIAQEAVLDEQLNSSPDRVRDYLKEEGYTEPQIKAMTKDDTSIEEVKKEIMARFKAQKSAIIKEMASKIESKTSTAEAKISEKDIPKLEKIRDELASRSGDLQNLVKFNNIVSSYLTVNTEGSKTPERNSASLFAEVKSLKDKDEQAIYQKKIDAAKLVDKKDSADVINLDVAVINKLMKYKTEPEEKEEDKKREPAAAGTQSIAAPKSTTTTAQ